METLKVSCILQLRPTADRCGPTSRAKTGRKLAVDDVKPKIERIYLENTWFDKTSKTTIGLANTGKMIISASHTKEYIKPGPWSGRV
jgi:hypothetical protein